VDKEKQRLMVVNGRVVQLDFLAILLYYQRQNGRVAAA